MPIPLLTLKGNKGYDMLVRLGWTKDTGLGRQGQGIIAPVAPASQMNRKGLGLT